MDEMNQNNNENVHALSPVNNGNDQAESSGGEIEISENLLSSEELINDGYKRIPDDLTGGLQLLLQKAPGHIANKMIRKSAKKSFNNAVRGSFRCRLDPGMHLAKRKGQTDVFLGTGLDNVSNKIRGQASWTKNDAVLTIPTTPEIISGVFNVMSIVTCQYYLSEINGKLSEIDTKLSNIERRLNNKDISKLNNDYKTLKDIQSKLLFIKNDPDRISANYQLILNIKKDAGELFHYFQTEIEDIIKSHSQYDDNEKQITEKLNRLFINHKGLVFSHYVYLLSNVMEIDIKNIIDKDELEIISKDLIALTITALQIHIDCNEWGNDYINKAKIINNLGIKGHLKSGGMGILYVVANDIVSGKISDNPFVEISNAIDDQKKEELSKKRSSLVDTYNKHFYTIDNMSSENLKIVYAIENYRKRLDSKTELVYIDGEWYFKNELDSPDQDQDKQQE